MSSLFPVPRLFNEYWFKKQVKSMYKVAFYRTSDVILPGNPGSLTVKAKHACISIFINLFNHFKSITE